MSEIPQAKKPYVITSHALERYRERIKAWADTSEVIQDVCRHIRIGK